MRIHRFFIKENLHGKTLTIADHELVNQWRNVLRFKNGDEVHLFNGTGFEAKAKILNFGPSAGLRAGKDTAELQILETFQNENELSRHVILYCSVLKRENFEFVVQKATEVGVKEIVPIVTERTEKLNLRMDRLEKVTKEAAEQSGRAIVPKIHEPTKFENAVNSAKNNEINLFCDLSGEPRENLKRNLKNEGRVGVFVGPEGGWTGKERASAEKAGFKKLSLGKLTLRAETAAIVASYLIVNL